MRTRSLGRLFSILWPAAVLTAGALCAGAACTAGNDSSLSNKENTGSNNGANGSGGGLLSGSGSGGGLGGACAGEDYSAEEQPLDMYIMLDQSGSMSDTNKWGAVTSALTQFVQAPDTVGIGVGIQYFPLSSGQTCPSVQCATNNDCGPCGPCFGAFPPVPGICMGAVNGDSCNVTDYATPEVPIAVLPGVGNQIISSMAAHGPNGGTPISAALDGAITYAKQFSQMTPNHHVIAVLATDGDPTSCDTNLANINAIAAAGLNGSPSILTFVIGVGQSLTSLNGIAQAGGTGMAFLIDTNQNVTQQFIDALNQIKGAALGCTYSIPVPSSGDPDYSSVNVVYNGSIVPKVNSAADCPANTPAWYYDNNSAPTKIILCDGFCAQVAGDDMAEIRILLGCATVVE